MLRQLARWSQTRSVACSRNFSSQQQVAKDSKRRLTLKDLHEKYVSKQPITMMTAYNYPTALLVDKAKIDMLLIGDSLGMVELGFDDTLSVTMDMMIHHCKAVARGSSRSFLVADMPFGSYETNADKALDNAVRFLKEGQAQAVKLEGGVERADTIRKLVSAGIPVVGHIGLTPQRLHMLGGYRAQGRSATQAVRLLHDAKVLQEAGAFSLVLECVPAVVAETITKQLSVPTIGIGAGVQTSGQVLVLHDLCGLVVADNAVSPKFCPRYVEAGKHMLNALNKYREDVSTRKFPSVQHTYSMPADEEQEFLRAVEEEDRPHKSNVFGDTLTDEDYDGIHSSRV